MRNKLSSTAMNLFSQHGFDYVTMEQIAEAADVAKGTLYNHFQFKEALVAEWVHQEFARDLVHMDASITSESDFNLRMKMFLTQSSKWCKTNKDYLPAYLRYRFQILDGSVPTEDLQTLDGVGRAFVLLIEDAQASDQLRCDLAADHLAEYLAHMYLGALMRWLSGSASDLDAEFEAMFSLFSEGAGTG